MADRSVVVNVLRHHVEHLRKTHKRDECRVEPLLLSSVGECSSLETLIVTDPVINIEDLLWSRRCSHDLGEEGIGIERNRREELIELLRSICRGLRRQRLKFLQYKQDCAKQNRRELGFLLHTELAAQLPKKRASVFLRPWRRALDGHR